MVNYVFFESASGFALFENTEAEDIGKLTEEVQNSFLEMKRFGKIMRLTSFLPFTSAENALLCQNEISEGILPECAVHFLSTSLPKVKEGKRAKFVVGVSEPKIGNAISETLSIPCECNDLTLELFRAIRLHFHHFIDGLNATDMDKAQLGLAHAYSRSHVKFDVNRADKHIIQAIALLDQMDKDLNTFSMRVREWYSWHFPELVKIVNDNVIYARLCLAIQNKETLNEDSLEELEELTGDGVKAQQILDASQVSMGQEIGELDMINITKFASRVVDLHKYRADLHRYLSTKMLKVAPNLSTLIGEMVGARLISHAGSLTSLAKYPASTVQILGAEKALFRALKTKGNTPKYGLIFHSSFIGRASQKNKGRISRYLANKASIASRIDSFSDSPSSLYGLKLREQVEERLEFYSSGKAPKKNIDVMAAVRAELEAEGDGEEQPRKSKKRKAEEEEEEEEEEKVEKKKKKKEDKQKKKKKKKDA
jgi:nucleolar protein 56